MPGRNDTSNEHSGFDERPTGGASGRSRRKGARLGGQLAAARARQAALKQDQRAAEARVNDAVKFYYRHEEAIAKIEESVAKQARALERREIRLREGAEASVEEHRRGQADQVQLILDNGQRIPDAAAILGLSQREVSRLSQVARAGAQRNDPNETPSRLGDIAADDCLTDGGPGKRGQAPDQKTGGFARAHEPASGDRTATAHQERTPRPVDSAASSTQGGTYSAVNGPVASSAQEHDEGTDLRQAP